VNGQTSPIRDGRVVLQIRGLRKRFGEQAVLDGIDLDVAQGDRIAIIGASGSGKSTFLRCLNFLEMPDDGEVRFSGETIRAGRRRSQRELAAIRQRAGMVFQHFNLFPHLTALGNVMEGLLTVRRMPRAQAQQLAREQLARVGLPEKAGEYPARLSGGQKQRVAIARAFLRNSPILILDEATSALDSESEAKVQDALRHLVVGKTVLIIAHRFSTIREASTILVFEKGRVVDEGTHAKLHAGNALYRALYDRQAAS
jgi:ABC-type polar amino acid transport system ATPase subunit